MWNLERAGSQKIYRGCFRRAADGVEPRPYGQAARRGRDLDGINYLPSELETLSLILRDKYGYLYLWPRSTQKRSTPRVLLFCATCHSESATHQ